MYEKIGKIVFHSHAEDRIKERGATKEEVISTIENGESFVAKFNRTGFRRNFGFSSEWDGKFYHNKQLEVYAVEQDNDWIVVTVIVKYF